MLLTAIAVLTLLPMAAQAAKKAQKLYRWVDSEGVVHFGDRVPTEFKDLERQIINDRGITVAVIHAKRTNEESAEQRRQEELQDVQAIQRKKNQALLATYLSVDEIVLHRDRRVELFQAQTRVTELYLSNLERQLSDLQEEASNYRPYSADPNAKTIDPDLAGDISTTKDTIERHQANLERFREDEQKVIIRFNSDIDRFKALKGLN